MAFLWPLFSCASKKDELGTASSEGKVAEVASPAKPPPADYLQRTSWLWDFQSEEHPDEGEVFFNITRGSLSEQTPDPYDSWPTILVRLPEGWRVVDFREKFHKYLWSHAAAAPSKGYFWGFLEYGVEDAGSELPLIMSMDGGRSWAHVATLQKPDREATLFSFEMNMQGQGQLRWMSRKDAPPGTRKIFTSVTTDWGKTWRQEPSAEVSTLREGQTPPNGAPCWVAVRNLPEPLPEECQFPSRVSSFSDSLPGSPPPDGVRP
ncbi:hypothetical protein [Hyalangium versicolor]|uniref:hypothetical protein n=1 Tax=Hyalangium versicolor TaxID=2861190 RepID=UPI001CCB6D09|nr:hypothetical protein [Hyalangium versicolor]